MIIKENRRLNVGILGCGPIAQFAHFEASQKGRNVNLYAICDLAEDLRVRMEQMWQPEVAYADYDEMLRDENVDIVIIATSDAFHVPMALKAVKAGKHVLIEKPMTHSLQEGFLLKDEAQKANVMAQIGHMRRFDPGNEFAKDFIENKAGELIALKAWYGDNAYRYTVTDNIQPLSVASTKAKKPNFNEKENKRRYYMMAHGSHLLDTALYFGGQLGSIKARLNEKAGIYCWFMDVEFLNGTLGHLDLSIAVKMDWHEGYQVYCTNGSVIGKGYNPWFFKSTDVQCFFADEKEYHSPLAEDGFSYRRQLEAFADAILKSDVQKGTTIDDGIHITRGMIAVQQSLNTGQTICLDTITEGELS
jgi:predicted dehydrogenase